MIVGEDKSPQMGDRKVLESLVAELGLDGSITMPGWSNDIASVLSSFTVFVSAARSEPFGLSIVEAMAAGLPVVATASEGALEIIDDGQSGKLAPLDNPVALAEAINQLLDDASERSRLGRNAGQAARERFSLTRMTSETERVYRDLLASA